MEKATEPAVAARPLLSGWRKIVAAIGFPLILGLAVTATHFGLADGASVTIASGVPILAVFFTVAILERVMPYRRDWRTQPKIAAIDIVHSLVAANGVLPLMRVTVFAGIATVSASLAESTGSVMWPSSLPFVVQMALAVLIADLGAYTVHRLMHIYRVGWRLHAVHHSVDRLDVFAAGRAHPFNAAATLSFENGLLILLGVPADVLVVFSVYKGTNGLLQHSNVDFRPGALVYVFATTDAHRWHHSSVLGESNTNFGNTTMVWDHIFGSFSLPGGRHGPALVGIDNARVPENYLVHLAIPWSLQRYERPVADTSADGSGLNEPAPSSPEA